MMVCISCISNVNQLGSSSHCDVMAQHLQGNREAVFFFPRAIYGFQDANFFKLNACDKQRQPARGFFFFVVCKSKSNICYCHSGDIWGQHDLQ